MLSVIPVILKYVGILLLFLLALVLLLLLLLLFVPIRYSGRGLYETSPAAEVRVSWLLKLVRFRLDYRDGIDAEARLGFLKLWSMKTPQEENTEDTSGTEYTDEELVEVVERFSVYARVQPEHKTRIVNAWQARNKVTAMTGDGVNDAPSIKAADIGIGMGITGTPVTKSAADMVLADDNFATIVRAIEAGRKIYDNICKVLQFQLSTNLAEVLIIFFASILNFTILTPVHLLWINMVTDTLPGLALGMEHAEGELMKRKPRAKEESIFANGAGASMLWQGVYLAAIEIAAYYTGYYLENGSFKGIVNGSWCENAVVMVFLTVSLAEMMCAVNMRSRTGSIFRPEMLQNMNWYMVGALVITVGLTLAAAFLPGFRTLFGIHGTLSAKELLIAVGLALSTVPVFEAGKAIHRAAGKNS